MAAQGRIAVTGKSDMDSLFALCVRLFLLFLAYPGIAHSGPAADERRVTLEWTVDVDRVGHVASLEREGTSNIVLHEKLERDIVKWKFIPPLVNGKPATLRTRLVVQVGLIPNPDGETYAIHVRDVTTGGALSHIRVPGYPEEEVGMLARGKQVALVAVEVAFDGNGKQVGVKLAEGSPLTSGEFVRRVKRATRDWTYEPERVDGKGIPGRVAYFICVVAHRPGESLDRQSDPCHWTPPGKHAVLGNGESLALDSGAVLMTPVIGGIL